MPSRRRFALARQTLTPLLAALLVLALAACESRTSVQGGASSDSGGGGQIKLGWPF